MTLAPSSSRPLRPQRRIWLAALAAVAVGIALTMAIVSHQRARARVEAWRGDVRALVSARRIEDARRLLDRWITSRPSDPEPYYLRAWVEVVAERPASAVQALERAGQLGYPKPSLDVLQAVLQAHAGRFPEAEPVLKDAFLHPKGAEPEVDEALARIYLNSFRLDEAGRVIDRWMKDAPNDPRPYLWRNEVDSRNDADPAVLIRNYRMALRRDPDNLKARLGLALKLHDANRTREAAEEFAACLARDPGSVEAHVGAGRNALQAGAIDSAAKHFRDALALNPRETAALRELGVIELRLGRFQDARNHFKTAVEIDPFDAEIRSNYARALKLSGDEAMAREQTAVAERLHDDQHRMENLRTALGRNPGDQNLRYEAAAWMLAHGHEKEGLDWASLVLRDDPQHAATCRLLADYHAKKGNIGLANYYRLAVPETRPNVPHR